MLRGLLGREGSISIKFDINKVDLHLLCGANTNDQRRTLTGGDNFVGVVNRLHQKTESTLQLLDDGLGEGGEVDAWVLIVDVLGELGNSLSVGFGLEAETLRFEQYSQFLVVGDDTVVNDGELPFGIRSGQAMLAELN